MHLASVLPNPSHFPVHTPQNTQHAHQLSMCTVPELQQGFASTEDMVISNFTENHRSNSVFPWEQIRRDVYIKDTWPSTSAQDHCSEQDWDYQASRYDAKEGYSEQLLLSAPGADRHFLDMHVSHDPLEKYYWHSLAPKKHDCWLHQLQPGTQIKAKVFRISWTME